MPGGAGIKHTRESRPSIYFQLPGTFPRHFLYVFNFAFFMCFLLMFNVFFLLPFWGDFKHVFAEVLDFSKSLRFIFVELLYFYQMVVYIFLSNKRFLNKSCRLAWAWSGTAGDSA